jgi:hypothetical protein
MAGDWLKVLKTTIDKPEIALIAEAMNCTQETAFGWWFRLYSYLDDATADGFLVGMTLKRLGLLARVPEAVCLALSGPGGWLHENVEEKGKKKPGVMVSNWERHNGKSAKKRVLDSRRSNEYYARKKDKKTPPKLYGA